MNFVADIPTYIFPPNIDYTIGPIELATFNQNGGKYDFRHGVTVVVPSEAIANGENSATMLFSASLVAPVNFQNDETPPKYFQNDEIKQVSALVWLCMNVELKKPVQLKMPHFLKIKSIESLFFAMSSCHLKPNTTMVTMKTIDGGIFSCDKSYGMIAVKQFCYFCIIELKKYGKGNPDYKYQIAVMIQTKNQPNTTSYDVHVCILPDLPTCLEVHIAIYIYIIYYISK